MEASTINGNVQTVMEESTIISPWQKVTFLQFHPMTSYFDCELSPPGVLLPGKLPGLIREDI